LILIEGTLPTKTTDEEKAEWKIDDVKARKIIIYSMTPLLHSSRRFQRLEIS
jgi:hypothetical protein